MFELVRCCRCNEPVRLPDASTMWVRCPHCSSEYPIDQVLSQLPPALEAIGPPSLIDSDALAGGELGGNNTIDLEIGSDNNVSSSGIANAGSGTTLVTTPRPQVVVSDPHDRVRTPDTLHAERKKKAARHSRRAQGGIIKVVLGGIAGLCLGQLILWWLPGQYQTDPMELAPKLPEPLAFLAPASLRGEPLPLLSSDEQTASSSPTRDEDENSTNESNNIADAVPISVEPNGKPNAKGVLLGSTPSFDIRELNEALSKAKSADAEFSKGFDWDDATLSRWYAPLRDLAHCATYANMSEPEIQDFAAATRSFVGKLSTDQRKKVAIANLAEVDLKNASHDRRGIVVTGLIDSISEVGHFFNTKLKSTGDSGAIVNVVSRVDPRKELKFTAGDEIVILGVVVADPSLYLLSYKGHEEAIVFGGLPYKVQK